MFHPDIVEFWTLIPKEKAILSVHKKSARWTKAAEFDGLFWPNGRITPPGNPSPQRVILSRWFSSFLKICDRFLEATSKGYEKLYTPPQKTDNRKSTIWRCISYWTWWFSNVIWVFRGVDSPWKNTNLNAPYFGQFSMLPVTGAGLVGGLAYDSICFSTLHIIV